MQIHFHVRMHGRPPTIPLTLVIGKLSKEKKTFLNFLQDFGVDEEEAHDDDDYDEDHHHANDHHNDEEADLTRGSKLSSKSLNLPLHPQTFLSLRLRKLQQMKLGFAVALVGSS